ncbi:TPA: HNH endonuclease [Bacillus thuringiensis]|nr:HNH endonuclease [Bacillus thuringiensis]
MRKGRELSVSIGKTGYKVIGLYCKGKQKMYKVHRLVALAFIPNPENKNIINHINGDKTNNFVENLEWTTQKENIRHAFDAGLSKQGNIHYKAKLTEDDVRWIREHYVPRHPEFGVTAIAKKFSMNKATISAIINNKIWKDVK